MKNLRVELTVGGKSLTEVKYQRGIFQEDAASPLLFVIVVMPLNYILEEWIGGYKLHKLQKKMNRQMYTDDIKLFDKNFKKSIRNPYTGNEDMLWQYKNGIWQRKMWHADYEKRETTHDSRNRTTKSRKNQDFNKENKKTNDNAKGLTSQRWHRQTICVKKIRRKRTYQLSR